MSTWLYHSHPKKIVEYVAVPQPPTIEKMFTGIVEEIGTVKGVHRGAKSVTLEICAAQVFLDAHIGDSICTNGVCLTITSLNNSLTTASFDVMPETVRRTSLASLKPGSKVNLERALTLQTRLGGHLVSGHIDGTGTVSHINTDDNARWIHISTSPNIIRYIIEKGSIAIQGVSLTVAEVGKDSFAVSLIPHTQQVTTLHTLKPGDVVNLENDIIAKYVEKLLLAPTSSATPAPSTDIEEKINFYRPFLLA